MNLRGNIKVMVLILMSTLCGTLLFANMNSGDIQGKLNQDSKHQDTDPRLIDMNLSIPGPETLAHDTNISLSSIKFEYEVAEAEPEPPYAVFNTEQEGNEKIYVTDQCPINDWVTVGQWTITPYNDDLKLSKVPLEIFRGPAGSPSQFATAYKIIVTKTPDYTVDKPVKEADYLARTSKQVAMKVNAALKQNTKYYLTLQAKGVLATPHTEAHVRILSYDHPRISDTTLGKFRKTGAALSRKKGNIHFKDVNLDIEMETRPSYHPNPVCKGLFYNLYYPKDRKHPLFRF
jgi:hypothetical protein